MPWKGLRFTLGGILVSACLSATAVTAGAQWVNYPTPDIPRTADGKPNLRALTPRARDGKPDMSGIWVRVAPPTPPDGNPVGPNLIWNFELNGPNALLGRGWTRNTLKLGEAVTVNGFLAKDGSHYVNAVTVKPGDGKTVFAGSSGDSGPSQ